MTEENHLKACKIGSRMIIKKINDVLQEAQKEVIEAEKLWKQITTEVMIECKETKILTK